MYCDLHNHLYGSIPSEVLLEIGKKNPNRRWELYVPAYEKEFGTKIDPKTFFEDFQSPQKFSRLYHFSEKAPFPKFQAKFNLIIALVAFDERELEELPEKILKHQFEKKVEFGEYRVMFPKDEPKEKFLSRLKSISEGFAKANEVGKDLFSGKCVISLHRPESNFRNYEWIKNEMEKNKIVKSEIVGLDFCFFEEGFPPKHKKDFFEQVEKDNKAEPNTALTILYHVGEAWTDKTTFSACRWVLESSEFGAHRLGHALALGWNPELLSSQKESESLEERKDTVDCFLENYESIVSFGEFFPKSDLEKEQKVLQNQKNSQFTIEYGSFEKKSLETFQNFCMQKIRKKKTVVESCPVSNHLIGQIDYEHLPLKRFLQNQLNVVLSTDDPGIFDCDMDSQFSIARDIGVSESDLELLQKNAFEQTSEKLVRTQI